MSLYDQLRPPTGPTADYRAPKPPDPSEPPADFLVPQSGPTYVTGGHEHEWIEADEGRDDGMLTAICNICGSGIHYHSHIHGVENGKLLHHPKRRGSIVIKG